MELDLHTKYHQVGRRIFYWSFPNWKFRFSSRYLYFNHLPRVFKRHFAENQGPKWRAQYLAWLYLSLYESPYMFTTKCYNLSLADSPKLVDFVYFIIRT